jgi:hypothetical protein
MILQYVYAGVAMLVVFAVMFVGIPIIVNNEKFKKLKKFFAIAADMVLAIEQEFGILERLEDETDEEYLARKAEFNKAKKMACREAIVETLVAFGLPVPLDETIDKAIEYGVKTMKALFPEFIGVETISVDELKK